MGILDKIFGDPNEKVVKAMLPLVEKINALEAKYQALSDTELKEQTAVFRKSAGFYDDSGALIDMDRKEIERKLEAILPDAFAAIREAAKRTLGQRHYDVQMLGGIVLHRGQIAEMKTGEGKTLVATLPLYLNALPGRGAQLVTVNDYLSRVGAGWMARVYNALGMSTGVIVHETAYIYDPEYSDESQFDERLKNFRPAPRKEAYNCDILYGTNNEFGFDYLRDNMVPSLDRMVQREHFFAIVDEVDSILIDEARTPLIISAPAEESTDKYFKFAGLVSRLVENEDYNVDEKMRAATLTENGISKMEKLLGVENIYTTGGVREVHHIEQALKAQVLFKRDRDYVVREGEVIIVDEFTGRLMHGRRYSDGLHQAIEAKEGVKIQRESQTLATVTFQNYFRMYGKLAGMTGTAITEAEEFFKIYNLETVAIPTNRPIVRKDMNDYIYRTENGKYQAVIADIKERHALGQPVLVGTISIQKNELLGDMLAREGIQANILNAKHHDREAQFIAQAGKLGAVTIATNMAGRGVDIILGGNPPEKDEQEKVKAAGGLHVIGTERHEARRIDNQLRGRAGRQGDPGSSRFYISMDDDLMRIFGGDRMKNMMKTLNIPEDMPIENKLVSRSIESAQTKVEGNNFDIRKHLVEYDDVLNKHREAIYRRRREILAVTEDGGSLRSEDAEDRSARRIASLGGREGSLRSEDAEDRSARRIASLGEDGGSLRSEDNGRGRLSDMVLDLVDNEIEQVVSFHTAAESVNEWNLEEIYQVTSTIFPVTEKLKEDLGSFTKNGNKLDKVEARTAIIEHLQNLARKKYDELKTGAGSLGLNWPEIEKSILVRSIDTLWIEHLEAISSMRQGIGLRGYGQRDPLVEYKKEAYSLYNELNNLIQKEVVYSIYKVGDIGEIMAPSLIERAKTFLAPKKTMNGDEKQVLDKQKAKHDDGTKVGRNDPCPCGSGKKFKKCHGAQ